jgi:hypothetical protein
MTDHSVGRVIDAIAQTGQLDNTLIILIYGDNGTSAEGGRNGMFNEMTYFNKVPETVESMLQHLDQWGGPDTYPHMAAGWAVMFDTPFAWTKQIASDPGGTRVGMALHWPNRIRNAGGLRQQFHHVIDIALTILEAANLPEPKIANGIEQHPMDGVSMSYTFADPAAKERHTTQYFEMFGNRAIYHEGWFARVIHKAPWESTPRRPLADDSAWELFDTTEDFSLINNLAAKNPEKLAQLKKLFLSEARRNFALPIDDRGIERVNASLAGRPDLMGKRTSITLAQGMTGMSENVFLNIKNKSKIITADIELPEGTIANGTIIAQGGRFGGWSLYIKDGIPAYHYNYLGLEQFSIAANEKIPNGKSQLRFEFNYDGGGLGKGGIGTLFINGKKLAEGKIPRTQSMAFSADETADVGMDLATPVVKSIGSEGKSKFTGILSKLTVEVK